jgi:dipeptidyl aminopeptidase/acylaminoacyl peptidase
MPRERNLSNIEYFNRLCARQRPQLAFRGKTKQDWRAWRRALAPRLRELLGEFPQPCPLRPQTLEREDLGDVIREKVIFDTERDMSVPAYVCLPKGRKRGERVPGILASHGHGPGKVVPAGVENPFGGYREYALSFARRGFVAIVPDYRGFGERADGGQPYGQRDPCNVNFIKGSLLGFNLLTLDIWDAMRAIDYLQRRSEVDPQRIGAVGSSFGGTMSLYIAALDDRVKCAIVSCYLNTFEQYAIRQANFCGSQFLPRLRKYAELADVCGLIAPKPLLIVAGKEDDGFPFHATMKAYRQVRRIYAAAGAAHRLDLDAFDGGHRFNEDKAFPFFDRWLKGIE